ncbi:MAG: molybdopterin molybdotransferase MoeA [Pseudomonadota bacterium]
MRHDEVLARLQGLSRPVASRSSVPLHAAAGRILAQDVTAPRAIPALNNAAVDGFAFAASGLDPGAAVPLTVTGHIAAGASPMTAPLPAGTAVRILTGAPVPDGCDTLIMQEDVRLPDAPGGDPETARTIFLPAGWKPGANVRPAGEDVAAGQTVARAGTRLRPVDLAAIASVGTAQVACFDRLPVAIASTGNEVRAPGAPFTPGAVYDSNAALLTALVKAAGADPTHDGIWPDDRGMVRTRLQELSTQFPLIVTTGGASGSEADHVSAALKSLGVRSVWRIAVKPGRPLCVGQIGESIVVGLPGNTVAVAVCALMYLWPMLGVLGGGDWRTPVPMPLRANFAHPKRKMGRREYWRARRVTGPDGATWVEKFARDGSGLISSLTFADGLIEIAEEMGGVAHGDTVQFIPFSAYGMAESI